MWYVYFLKLNNDDVYVGFTRDLKQRIAAHQNGDVTSKRGVRPVALMSYVAVTNRKTAVALERYFKSGSGKAFAKKRFLQ